MLAREHLLGDKQSAVGILGLSIDALLGAAA